VPPAREFLSSAKGALALVLSILGTAFLAMGIVAGFVSVGTQAPGTPGAVVAGSLAWTFGIAGAVFAVAGVVLGRMRARELADRERLRAYGLACDGVVLEVSQNFRVRVNRKHPWRVRYRYEAGGTTHEGVETSMDRPALLEAGSVIRVKYDPAEPERSAIAAKMP